MGQKVHPYGFRLGTLYGWQSNWFADKHYGKQLHEDVAVRNFIKKKLFHAAIATANALIQTAADQLYATRHPYSAPNPVFSVPESYSLKGTTSFVFGAGLMYLGELARVHRQARHLLRAVEAAPCSDAAGGAST